MTVRHCVLGLASLLLVTSVAASAQIENPYYKTWASCKPGTSVTLRSTRGAGDTVRTSDLKYTLIEVKPDECVLSIEMTMEVRGTKRTMPATSQKFTRELEATPDTIKGKEAIDKAPTVTITVPAGTFKAKMVDHSVTPQTAATVNVKMWVSLDVPGGAVKTETFRGATDGTPIATTELIAIDKK